MVLMDLRKEEATNPGDLPISVCSFSARRSTRQPPEERLAHSLRQTLICKPCDFKVAPSASDSPVCDFITAEVRCVQHDLQHETMSDWIFDLILCVIFIVFS